MRAGAEIILKPGVQVICADSKWGLNGAGASLWAKDAVQSIILQRLAKGCTGIDDLEKAVRESSGCALRDDELSLAVAEFILDFGEYLENPVQE